ncbi:AAA-like domain-containing protein [Nostoc sp. UCD121]|nr:AAA-like domain-containing protein [Nostoc sp. UCD121]MBC1280692.1 AAA-like domain-containing protein [Nostoc sp. UCD121]MBC1299158.1 AAA-like domain-containing protein [Nostoc sp. UCD122]
MNLDQIQDILNKQLLNLENRCLNTTELLILQGILQNQTYHEIAQQEGYSSSYFANVVAPELYRRLSQITGRRVTKKNCQAILQSYLTPQTQAITHRPGLESSSRNPQTSSQTNEPKEWLENSSPNLHPSTSPAYPCGAVPLDSPFYLKQPSVEQQIIEEITKPGALVRIKASQNMGKTSLLLRVLDDCEKKIGYKTVSLNLQKADKSILEDIDRFLRWLCINCARKLGLKPNLDEYWDQDIGSKMSWTIYFEEYLLAEIESPLVLALDEINQVFEHTETAENFLPLLRSCYEEAKRNSIWQKFRLIVVHSTEIYVPLQLEQSPFNIGLPIELHNFSQEQVKDLAKKYQLNIQDNEEIKQLMELVGGHPALIHLALYYISQEQISFEELLATAATQTGIYAHYLQRHWLTLEKQPELAKAFHMVCQATEAIFLEPIIAYKLNSIGLIYLVGNKATVSCKLYQKYFQNQWNDNMINDAYLTDLNDILKKGKRTGTSVLENRI